jgi:hypothetical protein
MLFQLDKLTGPGPTNLGKIVGWGRDFEKDFSWGYTKRKTMRDKKMDLVLMV